MNRFLLVFFVIFIQVLPLAAQFSEKYLSQDGEIHFTSDAPLELIKADSKELKGIIDSENRGFAFSVFIRSFEGFNSPLQREHFNENYLKSDIYPKASFTGKIIEPIDFSKNGTHSVRAKGILNIHGVEQERIIRSTVEVKNGKIYVNSAFTVLLQDHNISIPRIVKQKIAQEIFVQIEAIFQPQ